VRVRRHKRAGQGEVTLSITGEKIRMSHQDIYRDGTYGRLEWMILDRFDDLAHDSDPSVGGWHG
jgi:hypothetical protein